MRTLGTVLCLFLIIVSDGWQVKAKRHSETKFLVPKGESPPPAVIGLPQQAAALFAAGKYEEASAVFLRGYHSALARGETGAAANFLWGIANCDFSRHRYQQALEAYLQARRTFESLGESGKVSSLNGNLSSLYRQLGEYDAAIDAATRALTAVSTSDRFGRRARLLTLLADLKAEQRKADEAERLFREAIVEASRFDDLELLSNAWDRLGSGLLSQKRLPQAEDALLEAYRIRKLNHLPSLGISYRNLGMLRLEQGDLRSASALLDASIEESKSRRGRLPEWRFYHARGRLRLREGKLPEAHHEFRLALELARNYRLSVPQSDATRVGLEGVLQQLYDSFVESGTRLYVETGRSGLIRETFEALEENRAASLAARLGERKELHRRLPPAYWEQLVKLQSAETAALLNDDDGPRQEMRRLRGSIIELEAAAGGAAASLRAGLLERVQRSLDADTALFSFHLAQPSSWLWAVDKSGISLYRLPDGVAVAAQARQFRAAVQTRSAEAESLGRQLRRTLFGGLGPRYCNKFRWLLSLDEELFEAPLAALVAGGKPHAPSYLIENHSLRIISSAALWSGRRSASRSAGGFVGIGDAIYNTADPRWRGRIRERVPGWLEPPLNWPWKANAASTVTLGLSRLPGSGPEVAACAREWNGASVLLQGLDVTKENVRRALESRPSVVHFAAHVLRRPERSADSMVALSVTDSGEDQLLGPAEVGGWNVDADLIVLSGCASGAGLALPGAGLMGMTRAWMMAGARAVVATEWSTPDDVGVFFGRFYRRLLRSARLDPADALRMAQLETLRSGGWRSKPAFWAAYFAIGNY